jgi:hypothetical protein
LNIDRSVKKLDVEYIGLFYCRLHITCSKLRTRFYTHSPDYRRESCPEKYLWTFNFFALSAQKMMNVQKIFCNYSGFARFARKRRECGSFSGFARKMNHLSLFLRAKRAKKPYQKTLVISVFIPSFYKKYINFTP